MITKYERQSLLEYGIDGAIIEMRSLCESEFESNAHSKVVCD